MCGGASGRVVSACLKGDAGQFGGLAACPPCRLPCLSAWWLVFGDRFTIYLALLVRRWEGAMQGHTKHRNLTPHETDHLPPPASLQYLQTI